ncbi:MAG: glycosyltransferase family 9 protein [Bacteroidetes bacterium]|nr:glycosyltransferase family 9 protein [Bacteroidota bacterium]
MVSVKNILLVRTDRIGDVVLSLPMLSVLKYHYPEAKISVMVREYTRQLVEHHPAVADVILWDETKPRSSYRALLRRRRFDIAIVPYPRFHLALLLFLSRIPVRVGTGYRWYSFLFNKRIYEHRKDAKRHEVEYNLNLLKTLGIVPVGEPEFIFPISDESKEKIDNILKERNIQSFAVLHPGSGGSARDWKAENFSALGDELSRRYHLQIVVTGGPGDEQIVRNVQRGMKTPAVSFAGEFSLEELAALYLRAKLFVSNSTGPLHIAAMVGIPVIAFYPPIVQCSAVRWGPFTKKKRVFTADNQQCRYCQGGACRSNVCMDQITVPQVTEAAGELLREYV